MNYSQFISLDKNKLYEKEIKAFLLQSSGKASYWDTAIRKFFPDFFIDNLTDFNDSSCFTYYIALDGNTYKIGDPRIKAHLLRGEKLYYLQLFVSIKAPILTYLYIMYDKTPTNLVTSSTPFIPKHSNILSCIKLFSSENELVLYDYVSLQEKSPLNQDETIFQHFFEQVK